MKPHPSFGPVPPNVFAEAQALPFGLATKKIRAFAPTFGRAPGEPTRFELRLTRKIEREESATVIVEAGDEEKAKELARELDGSEIDWEEVVEDEKDFRVISIKGLP